MRVSGNAASGQASASKRAMIEKQIKTLEAKKRKLQKKLMQAQGGSTSTADVRSAAQTVANNRQALQNEMTNNTAAPATQPAAAGTGAQPATPTPAPTQNPYGQTNLAIPLPGLGKISSPAEAEIDVDMDPEQIMEMIQVIDLQITALRSQIDEDADILDILKNQTEGEDESEGASVTPTLVIPQPQVHVEPAGNGSPTPKVDGYV